MMLGRVIPRAVESRAVAELLASAAAAPAALVVEGEAGIGKTTVWLAGPDAKGSASWLRLPRPEAIRRVAMGPLSLGGLHAVLSEHLQRSFPRPTTVRIHQVSGGNPFYAIELARAMDTATTGAEGVLPSTLAELVRAKIGKVHGDADDALLTAACLAAPTVDVIARAIGIAPERVVESLEDAENEGIVGIDGHRVYFTHPLLARGTYTDAAPARRRSIHRRLAEIVEQPELRARHLALSATSGDVLTLQALDDAAELARLRGAPLAAAELLDLAIGLGGDTPARRIRSASHHFTAGDNVRARSQLEETIGSLAEGLLRAQAVSLLASLSIAVGNFLDAAELLSGALGDAEDNLAMRVQMLVMRSYALLNAEHYAAAARSAEDAVTTATRLGQPHLLSQALGMREVLRFLRGGGVDEPSLQRALELEDRDADIPLALRPSMYNASLLAWRGQLDRAHEELRSIRQSCIERGEESEMMLVAVHSVQTEIWRGNLTEATQLAEDAMDRALQLGNDMALYVGLAARAACAAYAGRIDQARRDISDALAASQRCATHNFELWVITTAGFLEVSLGNYDAAVTALAPLMSPTGAEPKGTEIFLAGFVPDAAEALVQLGRLDEAEPLIEALESNGRRLDRAWMLAVGARSRAMLLAMRGDVDAACRAAQAAMAEHDRLPMPFERARTQLLFGHLLRRQRRINAAAAELREALSAFEQMGNQLWADRTRAEVARASVGAARAGRLTESEQQVAELAASGMTNREIAAALFISPKTVETNVSRVYRKLGIHSRAELGRLIGRSDGEENPVPHGTA